MSFQIIRSDITKVKADVIVNTANPKLAIGGGTDSAIYHATGENKLLAERKKIGDIAPGHAAVTPAYALSAKHIIHTVGPYGSTVITANGIFCAPAMTIHFRLRQNLKLKASLSL